MGTRIHLGPPFGRETGRPEPGPDSAGPAIITLPIPPVLGNEGF